MSDEPSPSLMSLLDRLRLATPGQVQSVSPRVRRLARELPLFDSVWIDALAQARILTPLQAAEINAGRGEGLLVGRYVLTQRLPQAGFANCFAARHLETRQPARLLVIEATAGEDLTAQMKRLVDQSRQLTSTVLRPIIDVGSSAERLWAACHAAEGRTAAEWMVENGRFAPEVALHIARASLVGLVELERFGLVHGDLSAGTLVLGKGGEVILPHPGLRPLVRPCEGYAHNDLQPEAYDYLAPERITEGAPISTATEVYAAGCLWWHLLAGRPPFAGGNTLAKLRSVQAARAIDIRRLAPECPETFARIITACMASDPARRPQSFADVARALGSPMRAGQTALAKALQPPTRRIGGLQHSRPLRRRTRRKRLPVMASIVSAMLLAIVGWSLGKGPSPTISNSPKAESQIIEQTALPANPEKRVEPAEVQEATSDAVGQGTGDDSRTVLATHAEPVVDEQPGQLAPYQQPLILPTGRIVRLERLQPRAGQTVCGAEGHRPLVYVPPQGLVITTDDVVFENIDFVWEPALRAITSTPAMIVCEADRLEFRGCSFRTQGDARELPAAIRWLGPQSSGLQSVVSAGELLFADCVFTGVAAAIDGFAARSLTCEFTNCLHRTSGALIRWNHCPSAREPILITLAHTTLRGAGPVFECRYDQVIEEPGQITVAASDSAFVTNADTPLLLFAGPQLPEPLIRRVEWTGQGSLLAPEATVAAWQRPSGRMQPIAEEALEVGGLARSEVEFAGELDAAPSASQIIQWQAPLRSLEPPGIGPGLVHSEAKAKAER